MAAALVMFRLQKCRFNLPNLRNATIELAGCETAASGCATQILRVFCELVLIEPLQSRLALPKSAQFHGSIDPQYRAAEMSCVEWARAACANETSGSLVQTP